MKRTPKSSNEASEASPKKGRAKTTVEKAKGLGLFDHVKHIRSVQDPDYFDNLTELDLKSFNQFMILRALSMNPELLDDVAMLYRYLEKIPNRQFYKLLITLIPLDRRYYPWVKGKKKPFSKQFLQLIAQWFEVSTDEAEDYASILNQTDQGKRELSAICQGFSLSEKEVEKIMSSNDEE